MYVERSPWVLVTLARASAAGCGVDTAVSERSRSGAKAAIDQATAPPQSCPTTCARSTPAASSRATTSPTSSRCR
jgi:hypothetical protein